MCTYSYYPFFFLFSPPFSSWPRRHHIPFFAPSLLGLYISLSFRRTQHYTCNWLLHLSTVMGFWNFSRYCYTRVHPCNLFPVEVTGFNIEKLPCRYTQVLRRFFPYLGELAKVDCSLQQQQL